MLKVSRESTPSRRGLPLRALTVSDLASGKLEAAAEAFSNAVLNGYEATLQIEDYDNVDVAP